MSTLLFPGRHILNTRFQEGYLLRHLRLATCPSRDPLDRIVFAVTSANQCHSRFNPVPIEVRAIGVDRFARRIKETLGIDYRIVPIPYFDPSPRFLEFILKEIHEQTEGTLHLTPADTVLLSSTPEVIAQGRRLGFDILPAELECEATVKFSTPTPIEVLRTIVRSGESWHCDPVIRELLSPATFSLWQDFPDVPRRILRLYRDPLLNEQGSLTERRNYSIYAAGMNDPGVLAMKYDDIRPFIVPGKIVDEGCADGALLSPIARDFPDSDLIGIEITGEFLERCLERQRSHEYAGSYVHFHQRNLTEAIFEPNSIDTTICNSTTHELWSYGEQEKTLRTYLAEKYRQTRGGGRLLIRDVVGPEGKDETVYLWCTDTDGSNDPAAPLAAQSTAARFHRFADEFLSVRRSAGATASPAVRFRQETVGEVPYFVLRLRDAVEFMGKKDYLDNWHSEMNEEFAFWSFARWKQELAAAGFRVLEDVNRPAAGSLAYVNPWVVKRRWEGKVSLSRRTPTGMQPLPFPVTNMVLVGEKGQPGPLPAEDASSSPRG